MVWKKIGIYYIYVLCYIYDIIYDIMLKTVDIFIIDRPLLKEFGDKKY